MAKNEVVIMISGGLGNQMFQYAFARALKEQGVNVYIDDRTWWLETGREDYTGTRRKLGIDYFKITLPKLDIEHSIWKRFFISYQHNYFDRKITNYLRKKSQSQKGHYFYETGLNRISFEEIIESKENYYFNSYFQNPAYFETIRERLLEEFSLKNNFELRADWKKLLDTHTVIAVHVRRGDYVGLGETLSRTYYEEAIKRMCSNIENAIIFLFSDDPAWAEQIEAPIEKYVINGDRQYTDYEELVIMSMCHHFVISNSTFSWWGAWLSTNTDKVVIAPKRWFQDGTNEKIVPKEWIRM